MEQGLTSLSEALKSGDALCIDHALAAFKLKMSKTSTKSDPNVSPALLRQVIREVGRLEPCRDESVMLLMTVVRGRLDLDDLLEDMILSSDDSDGSSTELPLENLSWMRLAVARVSKEPFSPTFVSLLRSWSLFDAPSINPIKQSLFRARLLESLSKSISSSSPDCVSAVDEEMQAWILTNLFSSDDLTLQKAKELVVTILVKSADARHPLFAEICGLDGKMKVKYQTVSQLLERTSKEGISVKWEFRMDYLKDAKIVASSDRGLAPAVCDSVVSIINSGAASVASLNPEGILDFFLAPDSDYKPQLAKYLLPRLISACPHHVKRLASTYRPSIKPGESDTTLPTYILILLAVSNEFGGLPEDMDTSMLAGAIEGDDEEVRMGAFGCICRAFGPNKAVNPVHLLLIRKFLRHLLLDSTANIRQKALVSLQSLFCSLFSRLYSLSREISREHDVVRSSEELDLIKNWLSGLLEMMMDSLGVGRCHQFGCTDFSLRFLLQFQQSIQARTKSKQYRQSSPHDQHLDQILESIINETIIAKQDRLISCILDNSFDSNRQHAASLLSQHRQKITSSADELCTLALERLKTPREALADGASLLLSIVESEPTECFPKYLDLLESQLADAETNMAVAAAENNLNGTLCFLSLLIRRLSQIDDGIYNRTIDLAIRVGTSVSTFASQPSPEGSDLGQFFDSTGTIPANRSSQLILTFCWRAIKESANFLGLLISSQPIKSLDLPKKVIDHMVELLLSLRHPGAFCAIEDPLKMTASALFASGIPEVSKYPGEILEKAVEDCLLQPEIQVTRRSAGLPICLTSILTASIRRDVPLNNLMNGPAQTMLNIIKDNDLSTINPSPSVIHALNILRAIFRNANLDALSGPFTTASFAASFSSFNSASWSVRNGAMMLFGSLVRRAFGSASSKDPGSDLDSHLDLRQLATKFPDLLACFEEQIVKAGSEATHIYPILSILQRMRFSPGAISSYSSLYQATYTFLTCTCLPHKSAKIRAMATRLLVKSLLVSSPELTWPKLKSYLSTIKQRCSANELAAKLNLVVALCSSAKKLDVITEISQFSEWFDRLSRTESLPAAIRYPALVLADMIGETRAPIVFNDKVEPYMFEFASELIRQGNALNLENICWLNLQYRLRSQANPNPTTQISTALKSLQIASGPGQSVNRACNGFVHFGVLLSQDPASTDEALELLAKYPKNPNVIRKCLSLLATSGKMDNLLELAHNYLEPDNAYSDVIRMAVIQSFPTKTIPAFNFSLFRALRLALVDDDEDVRLEALAIASLYLDLPNLSLPATLESLHRHAHSCLPEEYNQWHNTLKPEILTNNETGVLFAAEPYNLFASPSWEFDISL